MVERIGELKSKRDLYSKHYLNSDGSITAEISIVPIHYRDEDEYKDCELNLVEERNWEFEYAVKKNNFKAYFNDVTDLENFTLASFEIINSQGIARWINYKLFGATPTEDIIEDNTILYKECFTNVDLKYYVDTWRLKEDIIIKAPVKFEYEFSLKLDGVRLEQQENGSIFFVDIDTEEILWRIERPYAIDANNKITYGVQYTLNKVVYRDIEYDSIKVTIIDNEFLSNAVYPIIIDPTTFKFSYRQGFVEAFEGTSYPPIVNYASWGQHARLSENTKPNNPSLPYRVINNFYIYNLSAIPKNAEITAGELKWTTNVSVTDIANTDKLAFYASLIATEWSDSNYTTTWLRNNYSATVDGLTLGSASLSSLTGVENAKITFSYPYRLSGATYAVIRVYLPKSSAPTGENYYEFYTYSDNALILELTYNNPPTTPTLITPKAGGVFNESCTITWTASTDADNDTITYGLYYSANGGSTWTLIARGISGTSYTWNTSSIAAGTNYKVRVEAYDGTSYSNYAVSGTFTIQHITDKVNIGGVWKEVEKRWCNIGGTWKEIDKIYVNIGGVWKET
mgnify:CR=1 FL=1